MTFSIRRVSAIVAKDVKDLIKNSYAILITILLPLGLAAMLSRSGSDDTTLLGTPINLALVITGAFIQATMMAEEKEKNTLRVLMLSPATRMEIMLGKSFLSSLITILVVWHHYRTCLTHGYGNLHCGSAASRDLYLRIDNKHNAG